MESKGSLPCSQMPAIGTYLELTESSSSLHSHFSEIHFNIILLQMCAKVSKVASSLQGFLTTVYTAYIVACMLFSFPMGAHVPSLFQHFI
jgi:hypothetical protein